MTEVQYHAKYLVLNRYVGWGAILCPKDYFAQSGDERVQGSEVHDN